MTDAAKRYANIKYCLTIINLIYILILLFLFLKLGLSKSLANYISKIVTNYFGIPVYLLMIYVVYSLLDFPLNFYGSYILEHKFSLSNQKLSNWLIDQIKVGIISYLISLILLYVFYFLIKNYPHSWWLFVSLFWIIFSLILAKLAPVVIIPLFFKYKKLADETLRQRIMQLADRMKIKILDVFEIDFSKKTLKANAAFVGWGATKRVLLADTLKDKYTHDEIEVILAHEFAHYKLRHLLKLILVNSLAISLSFYIIFKTNNYFLGVFNLSSLDKLAALPLIFIYLVLLSTAMEPFENYVSRIFERNADRLAIKTTDLKEAFISMMNKLASQNLADRNPRPIIKFFFFDHPPIDERIAIAQSL